MSNEYDYNGYQPKNYFVNSYAAKNPSSWTAGTAQNAASGGGVGGTATAIGAGAGALAGPVGSILGSVAGATVGGIFDLINGSANRKAAEKAQAEERKMAERQFAWGQHLDRFSMGIQRDAQNLNKKQVSHGISRDRINKLNEMLRTNVGLQDRVRQLWGGN